MTTEQREKLFDAIEDVVENAFTDNETEFNPAFYRVPSRYIVHLTKLYYDMIWGEEQ